MTNLIKFISFIMILGMLGFIYIIFRDIAYPDNLFMNPELKTTYIQYTDGSKSRTLAIGNRRLTSNEFAKVTIPFVLVAGAILWLLIHSSVTLFGRLREDKNIQFHILSSMISKYILIFILWLVASINNFSTYNMVNYELTGLKIGWWGTLLFVIILVILSIMGGWACTQACQDDEVDDWDGIFNIKYICYHTLSSIDDYYDTLKTHKINLKNLLENE